MMEGLFVVVRVGKSIITGRGLLRVFLGHILRMISGIADGYGKGVLVRSKSFDDMFRISGA